MVETAGRQDKPLRKAYRLLASLRCHARFLDLISDCFTMFVKKCIVVMMSDLFNPKEELAKLPDSPGVYMFKDANDVVIYVGRAVNLKNRVRSYFHASNAHESKIIGIRVHSKSFEVIVTANLVEALILECNLIKEYMPKYNVVMKDDKSYPFIRFTGELFPRALFTRASGKNGPTLDGLYFGPYTSSKDMSLMLKTLYKLWPLRRCKKIINEGEKTRSCLYNHIGQCHAPCAGKISMEDYGIIANEFLNFLKGQTGEQITKLNTEMLEASEELKFEKAAKIRDKIQAIKQARIKQNMTIVKRGDTDIIAFATNETEALAQVFFMRQGKIIGREHRLLEGIAGLDEAQIMANVLTQFYSGTPFVPKEIVIHKQCDDMETIEQWLSGVREGKVVLVVPQKGEKAKLTQMAYDNAVLQLKQFGEQIKSEVTRTLGAVQEIAEALFDENFAISRIEAYDISNIQGAYSVASMVAFEDGKAKRSDYRKFRIKTVTGANDFASMTEVLSRRFARYEAEKNEVEEKRKFSRLPDVIFVDGGKPQISATKAVLDSMGLTIPVCGMVKDDKHRTKGLLFNDREVLLAKTSEGFKLLTRIQDEVHRFAIEYHKQLRQKASVHSVLDDIDGIGRTRRVSLIKHFGSVDKIKEATVEQLAAAEGMNIRAAKAVFEFFQHEARENSKKHKSNDVGGINEGGDDV